MGNLSNLVNLFSFASIGIIIALGIILVFKADKEKQMQDEVGRLRKSLEEMDEQAKLIVRTDLELNKAQEALDKKVTSLYALQQLSREISTTLEENLIFKKIEASYLEDFGFEKALAFLWEEKTKEFLLQLNINYEEPDLKSIYSFIASHKEIFLDLIKNDEPLSSISKQERVAKKDIVAIFKSSSFMVSPILPKEGAPGFLFVGTENKDTPMTEGDEESIVILTNQLGQALDTARMFEKTWRAHQELEKRVVERTQELSTALDEVRKMSQRKTDFVSSVTHELRAPLTSIKGYAAILLSSKLGESLPEEVRLRLEKINKHSNELAQMVNDLLDISRIESGKVTMKQEPLNLKQIVEEVVDLMSVQAKEKQIELLFNIPENTYNVFADRNQMQRVFINIINNAVKFTPVQGKIAVASHREGNIIQIDITDTGYGIPEEAQEKIFEEFYRVDNPINQQVKGTGLGLTLVKHIIEAHKGKIWVRSKVGHGTTFSFTLPQTTN